MSPPPQVNKVTVTMCANFQQNQQVTGNVIRTAFVLQTFIFIERQNINSPIKCYLGYLKVKTKSVFYISIENNIRSINQIIVQIVRSFNLFFFPFSIFTTLFEFMYRVIEWRSNLGNRAGSFRDCGGVGGGKALPPTGCTTRSSSMGRGLTSSTVYGIHIIF